MYNRGISEWFVYERFNCVSQILLFVNSDHYRWLMLCLDKLEEIKQDIICWKKREYICFFIRCRFVLICELLQGLSCGFKKKLYAAYIVTILYILLMVNWISTLWPFECYSMSTFNTLSKEVFFASCWSKRLAQFCRYRVQILVWAELKL